MNDKDVGVLAESLHLMMDHFYTTARDVMSLHLFNKLFFLFDFSNDYQFSPKGKLHSNIVLGNV